MIDLKRNKNSRDMNLDLNLSLNSAKNLKE